MLPSKPGEYIYGLDGFVLSCPGHAWEFDIRTGDTVGAIDPLKLTTYPVEVENGEVLVLMRPKRGSFNEEQGSFGPSRPYSGGTGGQY
jgi:hypothetical protein